MDSNKEKNSPQNSGYICLQMQSIYIYKCGLLNYIKKSFVIQAITSNDCFFNKFVVSFNVLKFKGAIP